jgi:metal-responsive CopG/Arc/MetJ family transcriptional regulator
MVSTRIVNLTGSDVQLKEGNAGLTSAYMILEPNKCEKVLVDMNATYKTYIIASTHPGGHLLDLNSDFCTDYKIVYIRKDVNGKVFKDPVPRSNDLVNKKIKNCSGKRIALIEVITPNAEHGGLETQLAKLESGDHHVIEMDPTADHRKYYVAVVNGDNSLSEDRSEIKNALEHRKTTRLHVTFSSNKLQLTPSRMF